MQVPRTALPTGKAAAAASCEPSEPAQVPDFFLDNDVCLGEEEMLDFCAELCLS